jgi:GNAT superfamily N-acetyltransferase
VTSNTLNLPALLALRLGRPEDAFAICDVHRSAVRGIAIEIYSREVIDGWAPIDISPERVTGFAQQIENGEEIVVVAEDPAGVITGFGSIVPSKAELRAVYVRPEHSRNGVGRAILRRLEDLAREAGLTDFRMDASINAEAFYAANGFVSEARGEHTLSSGVRMACVSMRKSL